MIKIKFYDVKTNNEVEKELEKLLPISDLDVVLRMFEDGNYECDCNRSKFMYNCSFDDMSKCNLEDNTILIKIYDEDIVYYNELEEVEKEWDKFLADMGKSAFGAE